MRKGKSLIRQPKLRQFRLEDRVKESRGELVKKPKRKDCGKKDVTFAHQPALKTK
jgi:hypothetical protein